MEARSDADLRSVHRFSDHHRELLARSERAGCFYCLAWFEPSEILDWIDEPRAGLEELDAGVTALCPRCGIDAVLPSAAPIRLDDALLSEMHHFWF